MRRRPLTLLTLAALAAFPMEAEAGPDLCYRVYVSSGVGPGAFADECYTYNGESVWCHTQVVSPFDASVRVTVCVPLPRIGP